MVLSNAQQTVKDLTNAVINAPAPLQQIIMGAGWTPDSKQLVTLDKVKASLDNLGLTDLQNIVAPILMDKIFKTEFTSFQSNNPWSAFYNSTDEYGKTKEHVLSIAGTIVNLVGQTAGDFRNKVLSAGLTEKDLNPSTLDYFESEDIVYYTKHVRAFVMVASINFTELKGAFDSQGAWDTFTSRKTNMLMEQAREEESAVISQKLASMLIPQNIGIIYDDVTKPKITEPKVTLLADDYEQKDFVSYLQTYVNNIKFPARAIKENPLGLPLITKSENLVSYVTPDILTAQNFLETYAFTANKVTLPTTTEMIAPLPPVAVTDLPVDFLGTKPTGIDADGKYTGTVLPIAFIGDKEALDVVHSQLYTDTEVNKLREFFNAQVHDHLHVHISHEKNIRFFAIPIDTRGTLVKPASIATVNATTDVAADGKITVPTTLKDVAGKDVTVTAVVKDSTGTSVSNTQAVKAGSYEITFSASNYHDLVATATVGHA